MKCENVNGNLSSVQVCTFIQRSSTIPRFCFPFSDFTVSSVEKKWNIFPNILANYYFIIFEKKNCSKKSALYFKMSLLIALSNDLLYACQICMSIEINLSN